MLSLVACLLLLVTPMVPRQTTTLSVSGRVVTGTGKVPIPGAVISSGTARSTTSSNGDFTLSLAPGPARLDISAAGFAPQQVSVTVGAGMPPLEIQLLESAAYREQVLVTAPAPPGTSDPAGVGVAPSTVLKVAGGGDNIFRTLQTLPGVGAADELSSRITVRGGGPDQNLTVMDGIEIHNPYRLFGLTSAFNPETTDNFELTSGGFGVPYGDRLSSILLVTNRTGTIKENFAGSASLSLTDTNLVLEGKIPWTTTGSWLFSGRRTYYDLVAEQIVDANLPTFADLQLKTSFQPRTGHTVTVFGLRSREETDLTIKDDDDYLGDNSSNDVAAVTYEAALGARVSSRTIGAWYRYTDGLDVDMSFLNPAERSNTPNGFSTALLVFTRDLTVYDRSVRQDVRVTASSRHTIGAGGELHFLRTSWGWLMGGNRSITAANGSSVFGGSSLPSDLRSTRNSTRGAVWVQDRFQVTPRLRLEPGLRVDRSGVDGEIAASPRVSVRFDLTSRTALRASTGIFRQSPGYEKLLQGDYFVNLTDEAAHALTSERSVHVVGAFEHTFARAILARVEVYSKTYDRLVIGRLETAEETAARVAEYAFPGALASSVPRTPQITSIPVNGASGRAYGFDMYVERRPQRANDRLSGWASYTWGRADTNAYGQRYPFDYDRRHAGSVVGTVGALSRVDVSATFRIASGFARTAPVGVRVAPEPRPGTTPGTPNSLVPARDGTAQLIWKLDFGDVSNLNRSRLPMYSRFDLRISFKPKSTNGRWLVYVEVLNVTNRKNVSQLEPELDFDPTSDRPKIVFATDSGLPRLPSFGFRFRF